MIVIKAGVPQRFSQNVRQDGRERLPPLIAMSSLMTALLFIILSDVLNPSHPPLWSHNPFVGKNGCQAIKHLNCTQNSRGQGGRVPVRGFRG